MSFQLSYCTYLHDYKDEGVHCWAFSEDGRFKAILNPKPKSMTHGDVFCGEELRQFLDDAIICGRVNESGFIVGSSYGYCLKKMTESKARQLLDKIAKKFPDAKMLYCGTKIVENCFAEVA